MTERWKYFEFVLCKVISKAALGNTNLLLGFPRDNLARLEGQRPVDDVVMFLADMDIVKMVSWFVLARHVHAAVT